MRPDISLGQEVDGELHARGLSPTAAARAIGVPDRTLRDQLSGHRPVAPIAAQQLLAWLDGLGPWVNPDARAALVILGKTPDPKGPRSPLEPTDVEVDTVVLGIAVLPGRHDAVQASLKETFDIPLPKDEAITGYGGQGMVGLVADPALGPRGARAWWRPAWWMEDARWLRVQLSPWFPPHCRLVRRLLRLASARDARAVIVEVPDVYVARFDIALT